jgi:hypothetical protein
MLVIMKKTRNNKKHMTRNNKEHMMGQWRLKYLLR